MAAHMGKYLPRFKVFLKFSNFILYLQVLEIVNNQQTFY
jgi:hypothetical protein